MKRRLVTQAMAAAWATRALPSLAGPSPGAGRKATGAVGTGDLTLRLVVGEDVLAPTRLPIGGIIEGGTTLRTTVEFEVPTSTTRAVLRAMSGEARSEIPLALR